MTMQTIQNDNFKAEIDEHGAQLTHLYNLKDNFDYIWNGEIWKKHAPVLFPSIGKSANDAYRIDGKEYPMPQHGFANSQDFKVEMNTGSMVVMSLTENEETLKMFPFKFKLTVTFSLHKEGLTFHFDVANTEESKDFSFALGSHPAINVPLNGEGDFSDYAVDFEPKDVKLEKFDIVKVPHPYRTGKVLPVTEAKGNHLDLNHEEFDKGPFFFSNKDLKAVTLSSSKSKHSVRLDFSEFAYFTMWTRENGNAPYICLEPFAGIIDIDEKESELMTKEGNTVLPAGKTKEFEYTITFK